MMPEFLLEELKSLCEHSARKIVSVANVAKMLLAAERYQGETLKAACLAFVQKNMAEVCRYPAFEAEVSVNPKLSMFILQGMVSDSVALKVFQQILIGQEIFEDEGGLVL